MTLASAYDIPTDPYAAWQIANDAAWCQRLAALLSVVACKQNQERTGLDCRCNGCDGLFSQALPQLTPSVVLSLAAAEKTELETELPSGSASTATQNDAFATLDEIIDQLYEEPKPSDDFDDVELDIDDDELLALFPELAEDPWPEYPRFSEYQTEAPRHAVYRGRCIKCGGYVDNTRERQDDNVFRCLACGWRTSPEYERNRAIHAAGGEI